MNNTRDDILHLAKLSSLQLTDAEISALQQDVTNIVGYISQLDELDTTGVEPTYQVFEMENVWRADEIQPQEATRDQLLALTADQTEHQIKVPKVL